jgi:hypothetical protein
MLYMEAGMNRFERGSQRYFIEVVGALLLYAVILVGRKGMQGDLKVALTLASIVPVWLIALAVVRFYRAQDEYLRQKMLLSMAMGGGLTALILMSYGQLESIGLPPLSRPWAWIIMGFSCATCSLALAWRDHVGQVGTQRSVQWAATCLAIIAIPTVIYALTAPALGWPNRPGVLVLVATLIFLALNGWCIFVKRRNA